MAASRLYFCRFDLCSKVYHIALSNFLRSFSQATQLVCLYRLAKTYHALIQKHGLFVLDS
jgi:hypothetical protein